MRKKILISQIYWMLLKNFRKVIKENNQCLLSQRILFIFFMKNEGQFKVYELWLGHELITHTYDQIKSDPVLEKDLKKLERKKMENELSFFHSHGEAKFGHDCGFPLVSTRDWINDRTHNVCMCCSPNRTGKTCQALVKKLLKIIPCNPKWPIFKNGIKYYDWEGPKTLVILGYDKGKLKDVIWNEIQKWTPHYELCEFKKAILGGTKEPAWDRHPRVQLKCGSRIILLSYDQKASVCSGFVASEILPDEQMPLSFYNELKERGRTVPGGIFWDIPYTPHSVDGQAESGQNSWLFDMWTGHNTRGYNVLRTRIAIPEVPDHIYSKEQKEAAYKEHVWIPKQIGDERAIREGNARYYGIAQAVSGLYYPEVDRNIHFVDWTYDNIKDKGWTHYRAIDYGWVNATACGFWAVSPSGDVFMYDEYYVSGKDALEHAPAIIAKCGNERQLINKIEEEKSGTTYSVYQEVVKRQTYIRTWLDWHCFQNSGGAGRPISFFFQIGGLKVCESTTLKQEARAENLRAFLKINPQRKHMVTGKLGAPRMYISKKCVKWIWEWERCVASTRAFGNETHNDKETKQNKNDHSIDQSEYIASENPRYTGNYDKERKELQPISRYGGY